MEEEIFINKRITNKDVYDELVKQRKIQNKILTHAEYTNGKVAENLKAIELVKAKSIGVWITNHPFKFTSFVLVAVSILISDLRHPMIELITSLFL